MAKYETLLSLFPTAPEYKWHKSKNVGDATETRRVRNKFGNAVN